MIDIKKLITGQKMAGASLQETIDLLCEIDRHGNSHLIPDIEGAISEAKEIYSQNPERSLTSEVTKYVESTNGWFSSTEIDKELSISLKVDKQNRWVILKRLCEREIIEKHPTKNGVFRRIDDDAPLLDTSKIDLTKELDIRLPLDLHHWIRIFPKNIIVIAGVSDTGKTAFLLNVVQMNQDRYQGTYFSSEMGEVELKSRQDCFPEGTQWKWQFRERDSNFADVIRPDQINIIDWLEINSEFYNIGEQIKQIYSRLNNGICFIAIQKGENSTLGTGGQYSLHKARLYLTIDFQRLKIVKAKIPRYPEVHPKGWEYNFRKNPQFPYSYKKYS